MPWCFLRFEVQTRLYLKHACWMHVCMHVGIHVRVEKKGVQMQEPNAVPAAGPLRAVCLHNEMLRALHLKCETGRRTSEHMNIRMHLKL